MAGLSKNKFDVYKCSANEAIHFKLVRKEEDLDDDTSTFPPEMTHQVFGENESIFGYKDLVVEMYYTAAKLTTFINLQYITKVSPELHEGLQADDVIGQLRDVVPPGFLTSRDAFISSIPKDADFKPFGKLLHSFTVHKDGKDRQFEIYKTGIESPGFREYHERLQTFILFFIDAASFIDVDDERWRFFLLFEKYMCNGNPMYAIAGYMTVYNYYAYPEKLRPRVSQVLILPPFQRMGLCAELLQTFYNDTYRRKEVLDITVEDPSENFQRVRDFVDVKNCQSLSSFRPERLLKGFSEEMQREAREKFKLNKRQTRRVYEILRLKATDTSNKEQYKAYRLDMKRRLNAPFQKNGRDFDKLKNVLRPDEFSATLSSITEEQRHQYLETTFQENVEMYRKVIDRLATS
ncbi:histone acetyltransferase type B catalytic subunit-like [Saccostrea echinata]|uniref:histone acetyltransferase type B catalytic subunit-like n=1 Tax=Saccostrea echinata TaxID=191078 RepID=UPI002A818870|nr:histone acetyltransferase type B catalytic subunit-like [Saccostrea echinata]